MKSVKRFFYLGPVLWVTRLYRFTDQKKVPLCLGTACCWDQRARGDDGAVYNGTATLGRAVGVRFWGCEEELVRRRCVSTT